MQASLHADRYRRTLAAGAVHVEAKRAGPSRSVYVKCMYSGTRYDTYPDLSCCFNPNIVSDGLTVSTSEVSG